MLLAALAVVGLLSQEPAPAPQPTGQDWTIVQTDDANALVAMTAFDSGIILTSRCINGAFDVTVFGLPPARGYSRELRVAVGDEEPRPQTWTIGSDRTAAFSRLPAFLARRLAEGGQLQIAVPGSPGQPGRRYVMELPPSPEVLERTLSACGRPLVDPRDRDLEPNAPDGLSGGMGWVIIPNVVHSGIANGRTLVSASVSVSCVLTAEGRMRDCVIESEHPPGFRLGQAVLRGLYNARVRPDPGSTLPLEGRMVTFTIVFRD